MFKIEYLPIILLFSFNCNQGNVDSDNIENSSNQCRQLILNTDKEIIDFALDENKMKLHESCLRFTKSDKYKYDLFLNAEITTVGINHKKSFRKEVISDESGRILLVKLEANWSGIDTLILYDQTVQIYQEKINQINGEDGQEFDFVKYYLNDKEAILSFFGGVGGNVLSGKFNDAFNQSTADTALDLMRSNDKDDRFIGFILTKYLIDQNKAIPESLIELYDLYHFEDPTIIVSMACTNRKLKYSDYKALGLDSILFNHYQKESNSVNFRFVN